MKVALSVLLLASAVTLVAKEPFQISQRTEKLVEGGEITVQVLRHGSTEIEFLPLAGWGCLMNAEGHSITFRSSDLNATISLEFHFVTTNRSAPTSGSEWRRKVAEKYPEATVVEESKCYASDLEGVALDLEQGATESLRISRRLARVQFPGGAAEFTLTTPGGKLKQYLGTFGGLLTSFRVASRRQDEQAK